MHVFIECKLNHVSFVVSSLTQRSSPMHFAVMPRKDAAKTQLQHTYTFTLSTSPVIGVQTKLKESAICSIHVIKWRQNEYLKLSVGHPHVQYSRTAHLVPVNIRCHIHHPSAPVRMPLDTLIAISTTTVTMSMTFFGSLLTPYFDVGGNDSRRFINISALTHYSDGFLTYVITHSCNTHGDVTACVQTQQSFILVFSQLKRKTISYCLYTYIQQRFLYVGVLHFTVYRGMHLRPGYPRQIQEQLIRCGLHLESSLEMAVDIRVSESGISIKGVAVQVGFGLEVLGGG